MKGGSRNYLGRGIFGTGWARAALSIALVAAVFFMSRVYELLNHGPAVLNLQSALDRALPLVPIFVIPYISLQPYIYASLILFLFFRTRVYQSAALSFLLAWAVSYVFYALLQTEVQRPLLAGSDFFTRLVQGVYAGDRPYNDFPSLHTSLSAILAIHWFRFERRLGAVAWLWTGLIIASTVLIKQHYVADLAAGLVLALGVSYIFWKLLPEGTGSLLKSSKLISRRRP